MPKQRLLPPLVLALLLGTVLWLRGPSFAIPLWNVDESIHAAVARTLLDGGTLYRDAIDQRTPLTYYAVAAIFGVAGANNLFAVRLVLAGLIAFTAFGLFLLGRRQGIEALAHHDVAGRAGAGHFAGVFEFDTVLKEIVTNRLARGGFDHRAFGAQFLVRQNDDLSHASSPILISSTLRPARARLML